MALIFRGQHISEEHPEEKHIVTERLLNPENDSHNQRSSTKDNNGIRGDDVEVGPVLQNGG